MINLLNFNEHKAILEKHIKNKNFSPKINSSDITKWTLGFSEAKLVRILKESAILVLHESKNNAKVIIKLEQLFQAIDFDEIGIAKQKLVIMKRWKK